MVIRLSREPAIEKARSYHRRLIGITVDFPNSLRLSMITQASYLLREPKDGLESQAFQVAFHHRYMYIPLFAGHRFYRLLLRVQERISIFL